MYLAILWTEVSARNKTHAVQEMAEQHVTPWLEAEQKRPETEYAEIELGFVNIGNNFLKKGAESRRGAT